MPGQAHGPVAAAHPEAAAAPSLPVERRPVLGRDDQSTDTVVDVITEEQLLRGMESLTPTEPSANGGGFPTCLSIRSKAGAGSA